MRRIGTPASPARTLTPVVSFGGAALYFVQAKPPALGSWELAVFLGDEQIPTTTNVTVVCPKGQVPMPDGDTCGCEPGTILKLGAAALLAAGVWPETGELCEACKGETWSVAGADSCDHCAKNYYREAFEDANDGSALCAPCPPFAVCQAYTTLATLDLKPNFWRPTRMLEMW